MFSITKEFKFEAAHRLLNHQGKCRHLHGHSYVAQLTLAAPQLNALGMVLDFADLKATVGKWIDDNWDHNVLLSPKDPLVELLKKEEKRPYLMQQLAANEGNPTAEGMAKELCYRAQALLPSNVGITCVRIYETATCWADYIPMLVSLR